MPGRQEKPSCLICGVSIVHSHLGIDSCRACAVFYKRTVNMTQPLQCKGGSDDCASQGTIVSCRKCRFKKFKKIYDSATATDTDKAPENKEAIADPDTVQDPTSSFIDHDSIFDCVPSCSAETPILERMRAAYCALCNVRKANEISRLNHRDMHEQLRSEKLTLIPAKYSDLVPNSQIFFSGIMDFARASFVDFRKLPAESRHDIVQRNFQLIQSLDGSYRGYHHFPLDDTVMATYMTFVNDETLQKFFDDCPSEINKDEAIQLFCKNMKRTINITKSQFRKVKPSIEEFIALFGLAFWNDYTSSLSVSVAQIANKNRAAIMDELHKLYIRKNLTDYAPRLGELLCLLANEERVLELTIEDIQMYRMMNIYDEAYK